MKTAIKFFLIIIISMISFHSYAQSFGVKGGLNLANMIVEDEDGGPITGDELKMNPGFHIGAAFDYPFSDILSLETGLILNTKGFKIKEELSAITLKTNLIYIDIPITLKASYDLGGVKLYGLAGPYVGMGLSGKNKVEMDDETDSEKIVWGNNVDTDNYKRLDMGLSFGGGIEISTIQIGISYDLGLANIFPDNDYGYIAKNRVLKFSVGYLLGK